ncbi:MAG: PH domain-containing protein [Saprospiraceae bacterium]
MNTGDSTTFENNQIYVSNLPTSEDVIFSPLEVKYRDINIWINLAILGVVLSICVAIYLILELDFPLLLLLSAFLGILIFFGLVLAYTYKHHEYRGYAVRQQDIIFKSGVFFRTITTLPFKRVQHCEVEQGPLERRFGLASLAIYTAGGSSSDLEIHGLTYENAMAMKSFITKVIGNSDEEE